jgi:hypothetical protein
VSPVRYELGLYIPEDGIVHSHRRENLKSYISTGKLKIKQNWKVSMILLVLKIAEQKESLSLDYAEILPHPASLLSTALSPLPSLSPPP